MIENENYLLDPKGATVQIASPRIFKLDLTKVKTLEDVIDILEAMDMSVQYWDTCPEQFTKIYEKGFLKEIK